MDTEGKSGIGTSAEAYKHIRQARRYRINTKKFARSLALMGILIAVIVTVCFMGNTAPTMALAAPGVQASPSVAANASAAPSGAAEGKVVVVDAGHGGFDIGATGVSGAHESDLNLKVATDLKADLEQEGVRVIMTREDEDAIAATKDEDMAKRRQIIQESGSDIVVSVHMNADTNTSASGPVVLFSPGANQAERLAKMIQNNLMEELEPPVKNNARAENLFILQSGKQTSVLVECGFITNAQEEALLLQEDYQKKVAKAITMGCMEFFES